MGEGRIVRARTSVVRTFFFGLLILGMPMTVFAQTPNTTYCYPMWSIIPFVGMLLSIALLPLINGVWWSGHKGKVSFFWILMFVISSVNLVGVHQTTYDFLHIMLVDYIPFLILIAALFIISGGIHVTGRLPHTPLSNAILLSVGAMLASIVGTTGATMLLIRPLIKANHDRSFVMHTIIFLIFIVSNIGGCLSPIGDPPLLIGHLHGVPFFWTLNLWKEWLFNVVALLVLYFLIDAHFYRKHLAKVNAPMPSLRDFFRLCHPVDQCANNACCSIKICGMQNFLFLLGTIGAVLLGGTLASHPAFIDAGSHVAKGITIMTIQGKGLILSYANLLRDAMILFMAYLSWRFTSSFLRRENDFAWAPIEEIAVLFVGIFATIIPALNILQVRGSELGVTTPMQFFWAAGALSSFLDNTPTYLSFLSLAGQMGNHVGIMTDLGVVNERILMAISCGSVFMGANTYIGNAPNFMARSIAEAHNIKMPSFFGYMLWSGCILLPLFLLNTILFFK